MKKIIPYILILLCPFGLMAQNVSINQGGTAPDNSAMLDVSSTTSGLLIPRMTLVERNALVNPANSLLIYQTDNVPGYYFNSGTTAAPVWVQLSTSPDNLGNHIATTNIQLGTNYLSGDGDNEGIFVSTTGDIGIGVVNPSSPFNLKRVVAASADDGAFVDIQNGSGTVSTLSGIRFKNNSIDGNVRYNAAIFHRLNSTTDYQLNFGVRLNALNNIDTSDIKMTINNSGNVGIGTTVPSNRLTVSQNSTSSFMSLESGGSNTLMDFVNTGINPADWTFGYLGNTGINPGFMTFLRAGVHRMAITNNGDVGIGTTTPAVKLTVDGGGDASLAGGGYIMTNTAAATNIVMDDNEIMARNNGLEAPIYFQNDGGDFHVHNGQAAGTEFIIEDDGSVGVRTSAPLSDIHIEQSDAAIAGTGGLRNYFSTTYWRLFHSGVHYSFEDDGTRVAYVEGTTGNYVQPSDSTLKSNINEIQPVLGRVMKLRPVSYFYKGFEQDAIKTTGFLAQDVAKELPNLVKYGEGGQMGLAYSEFSVIAIKAIQEQQEMIDNLNERIEKLEILLNKLKSDE